MKREKGQKRRKGLFAQDFLALTAASPGQDAQELEQTSAAQTLKKKNLKSVYILPMLPTSQCA